MVFEGKNKRITQTEALKSGMLIEQYIYTRLSAAQSPRKTTGFQSAFLPAGLKTKLHAVNLESHVHLHDNPSILEKRTVFWVEVDREFWQVILFVKALPQARDEFGRAGVFLAHGFLIPPSIWHRYSNPLRLSNALEGHVFHSIDSLLQSPQIDFANGVISAIDLGVLPEADAEQNDQNLRPLQRKMLVLLCRILKGDASGSALVYQGSHKSAESFFAGMAGLLPREWRARMAWDTAFDGGKLFFAPHNCVAFTETQPVTGKQAVYLAAQEKLEFSEPDLEDLCEPFDPFTRWLAECKDQNLSAAHVEAHFQFSEILNKRLPFSGMNPSPCFAKVNEPAVREWLREATDPMLPQVWRNQLHQHLSPAQVSSLAACGFQDKALAACIASIILQAELTPSGFRTPPPGVLSRAGEPRFNVLATMWTKEEINPHWLLDIVVDEREQILKLLARNGITQEEAAKLGFMEMEIQSASGEFQTKLGRFFRGFFGK